MVSWKTEIVDAADTTVNIFGGKSLNYVLQYFKAIDLSQAGSDALGIADINTYTYFANNVFHWWDSNKSHKIKVQTPDYTEEKTFTFPNEAATGPTDEFVLRTAVQTLTGKVIDFNLNTILNITKAALPSTIFFTDQDNDIGAHIVTVQNYGGTVTTPAAGKSVIYRDSATGKVSIKKPDGNIYSLEEGNFLQAGGFAAGGTINKTSNASDTVFTIAHGLTNTPQIPLVIPTNTIANADRTVTVDATNITITYNVPPPTGTLSFIWGAAYVNPDPLTFNATSITTLTNKTINIDSNTLKHSTTNVAGDLLKGNATQFIRWAKGTANQIIRVNASGTDLVWDDPAFQFLTGSSFIDLPSITPPANPADITKTRQYGKTTDANNNTLTVKQKINGAMVEVHAF